MFGRFSFNAVGQGLFYSGKINTGKRKFNIVYDCGSLSPKGFIEKEVNLYDMEYCNEDIDLLTISHFDCDHFNGIPELLIKHGVKVVVLPYLTKTERILLGFSVLNSELDEEEKQRLVSIYYDPLEYFRIFAENVVVIFHGENDEEDRDWRGEGLSDGFHEWSIFENSKCSGWSVNHSSFKLNVEEWEFIFYNKRTNAKALAYYIKEFDDVLDSLGYSIDGLHEMMRDYKAFANFKKKIKGKMPFKNMNENSVIMYHGPVDCNYRNAYHNHPNKFVSYTKDNTILMDSCSNETYLIDGCRCGTLLTGDYDTLYNDWEDIVDTIGEKRILRVGHFQVPHHGANTCFNLYDCFDNCIISYGAKNKYNHPHKDVLSNIARSKTQLRLVNEWHNYVYYIEY